MLAQEQLQAHDLLWGMTLDRLDHTAPDWVKEVIELGHPVVVRRALTSDEMVAVGVRGAARHQRYATEMLVADVTQQLKPEDLIGIDLSGYPLFQNGLKMIDSIMNQTNLIWGYTGSVGYELATGIHAVTETSDIDLLIRSEFPMAKDDALNLIDQLEQTQLKIDAQLQTPNGGVALKEWARTTGKVLLKRDQGAILVDDPWSKGSAI